MRRIYTFYENVPELNAYDELRLVTLWRRSWSALGFEPFVLNEYHARQHPMFAEYDQAISKFPSCNPSAYDRACFLRWLAFAQVGGGFIADYDLFAYGQVEDCLFGNRSKGFTMLQQRAPSLVHCGKSTAERLCKEFSTGKYGNRPQGDRAHYSDMYGLEDLIAAGADWIEQRDIVKEYTDKGWETAPFVHWAHDPMARANKLPKWKHIPTLRK